jgi:AcrR family transcriptional regulator
MYHAFHDMQSDQPIFSSAAVLPRGPHTLSRDEVAGSQRARLMAAFTTLMAQRGYAGVTVGELAREAGVSRATFYEHFADKEQCLLAAYDHFAGVLLEAMSTDLDDETAWDEFVDRALTGYLGALERDPVAARAYIIEMDAAGPEARRRRREAINRFAALIAQHHAALRAREPDLGPLPDPIYLALALAARELVRHALEDAPAPTLTALKPTILTLIAAVIRGA